jgi:hypothetical protein
LESLLDNIFSVFSNPRVALRKRKNSWPMAPYKRLKCLLIAPLGSGHKRLVRHRITEGNDAGNR